MNQHVKWISRILVNFKTLKAKIMQSDWFMRSVVKIGWLMDGGDAFCTHGCLFWFVCICLFSWQVCGSCTSPWFCLLFICPFCSLTYFMFDTFVSLHVCLFVLFSHLLVLFLFSFLFIYILFACFMLHLFLSFTLFAC